MRKAIYLCTNTNHIPLIVLALENVETSIPVFVYCDTLDTQQRLAALLGDKVQYRLAPTTQTDNFLVDRFDNHFFYGMSLKVFAANDLAKEFDRLVYLDNDVIVNGSLDALFDVDMTGFAIGGVLDIPFTDHDRIGFESDSKTACYNRIAELGVDPYSYINTGVIIMDCHQLKDHSDYDAMVESRQLELPDQDYFNIKYNGQVKVLPRQFNYMTDHIRVFSMTFACCMESHAQASEAIIQHFHGAMKPWKEEGIPDTKKPCLLNFGRYIAAFEKNKEKLKDYRDHEIIQGTEKNLVPFKRVQAFADSRGK